MVFCKRDKINHRNYSQSSGKGFGTYFTCGQHESSEHVCNLSVTPQDEQENQRRRTVGQPCQIE